jgi:hypothetical protein
MATALLVLLNVIGAAFIAILVIAEKYISGEIAMIVALLLFFSLLAFIILSIINIVRSSAFIKQKNEEKLKKSTCLLKIGAIPFWIAMVSIHGIFKYFWVNQWIVILVVFYALLYVLLLGTSVFSIAYIQLLYKEKKLGSRKAAISTLLQFVFFLDIISTLFLGYSGKGKKSAGEMARFFLGSYKPPEFIGILANAFKRGPVFRIAKTIGAFFAGQWQNHRVRFCLILAVLCLIPIGYKAYTFYESRKPQPIMVRYSIQPPGTTGNPEYRPKLSVQFRGSAATVEMKDTEVPAGMITINPPIDGVWKWAGDDQLIFSTEQNWRIGKRYTVTFS